MKIASYDIVFQEVPGQVTLALNITQCPNHCPGCHSPHLQEDTGLALDRAMMDSLLEKYARDITCVCFMGGDSEPETVMELADYVHDAGLLSAWYSGRQKLPDCFKYDCLDYVKVGPYVESRGPLSNPDSNQKMYRIEGGELKDITHLFWKKH